MSQDITRRLHFEPEERAKLGKACQVLGIYFEEFVHDAAMHAADEVLGINDQAYRERRANVPTSEQYDLFHRIAP